MRVGTAKSVKKGEDSYVACADAEPPAGQCKGARLAYAGVFDGHGGRAAAQFCAKEDLLPRRALEAMQALAIAEAGRRKWAELLPKALELAFVETDAAFGKRNQPSGTTATLAFLHEEPAADDGEAATRTVVVANVGDSMVYMDDGSKVVPLSTDHRVENSAEERARVVAAGGEIARASVEGKACGPPRVWPGGLQMSRTIGDGNCADPAIVIAQHMPAEFTRGFARRLNEKTGMKVSEAKHGQRHAGSAQGPMPDGRAAGFRQAGAGESVVPLGESTSRGAFGMHCVA